MEGEAFATSVTSMVHLFVQVNVLLVASRFSEGFVTVRTFKLLVFVNEMFVQLCNGFTQ